MHAGEIGFASHCPGQHEGAYASMYIHCHIWQCLSEKLERTHMPASFASKKKKKTTTHAMQCTALQCS